tara:strand:+ start:8989 stop:9192 length:204 start_codon:yes stop_codon:yes gene_type:complete
MVKVQLLACNRKYCLKAFTISARPKALLTLFRRDFFATLAVMFINDRFGSEAVICNISRFTALDPLT